MMIISHFSAIFHIIFCYFLIFYDQKVTIGYFILNRKCYIIFMERRNQRLVIKNNGGISNEEQLA